MKPIPDPKQLARREEALRLRSLGYTFKKIGTELGVSAPRAYQLVQAELKVLAERRAEIAETIIEAELQKLDAYASALAEKVDAGDVQAITAALKIQERRSKLLGLDAAQSLNVTSTATTPAEARAVMAGLFGSVTPNHDNGKQNGSNGHGSIPGGNGMPGAPPGSSSN